jgi:hypothetical protein
MTEMTVVKLFRSFVEVNCILIVLTTRRLIWHMFFLAAPGGAGAGVGSGYDSTPRLEPAVIVRFTRQEVRDTVISKRKALKGTRYSILEDLTNLNVMTLNCVRNYSRVQTCWTWNGRIYALLRSGEKILVRPFQPINECQRLN